MTRASFATLLLACVACGSAPKAPAAKAPEPAAARPEGDPAASDKTDDRPVASGAKSESFVVVPRPGRSLARLRALLRGAPAAMMLVDRMAAYGRNIDFEQPVYTVLAGGSSATSMGLTPDIAKATRESGSNECDVVDVQGAARIVCPSGPDGASLKSIASAPPPASTSDVHLEMTADGLAKLAFKGGGTAAILERLGLESEIRSITGDVALEGPAELRAAIGLAGKGRYASVALAAPAAAPPSTFARLPADAELALFVHAPAPADQASVRKDVLDGMLASETQCTDAERADARAHFEKVLFTGGSVALAAGFDRASSETSADALMKAPADKKKQGALRAASAGWYVIGVEEPAAKWIENVTWLSKSHCAKDKKPNVTVVTKLSPRLGLPAGSVEIIERKVKDPTAPISFTFVVPDRSGGPERTWIGLGEDEAILAARVRAAALGAPDATLAKRSGLTSLRDPATIAGFVTAAGIAWFLGDTKDAVSLIRTGSTILRERSLATAARTPILFRGEITKDKSGDGQLAARISVDGAAIGDLAAVVPFD